MRYRTAIFCIWTICILSITKGQDSTDSREAVICSDSKDSEIIGCKDGPMYIKSATAYCLQSWQFCQLSEIKPVVSNIQPECQLEANSVYESCHGVEECTLTRQTTEAPLPPGQCSGGNTTNVLHVTYSCYNMSSSSATVLPALSKVVENSFDIFSPQYPCYMPGVEQTMECMITRNSSMPPLTISLDIEVVRLKFGTSNRCWEDVTLETKGAKTDLVVEYCSGENREVWKRVHSTNSVTSLTVTYKSKLDNITQSGGLFWIKIKGSSFGELYKMSCSSMLSTNITLPMSGDCTEYNRSLDDPKPALPPGGENEVVTNSTSVGKPESSSLFEGGSGTTREYIYIALGCLALLVIIIIVLVTNVCMNNTSKKKETQTADSIEDDSSVTNINGSAAVVTSADETTSRTKNRYKKKTKYKEEEKEKNQQKEKEKEEEKERKRKVKEEEKEKNQQKQNEKEEEKEKKNREKEEEKEKNQQKQKEKEEEKEKKKREKEEEKEKNEQKQKEKEEEKEKKRKEKEEEKEKNQQKQKEKEEEKEKKRKEKEEEKEKNQQKQKEKEEEKEKKRKEKEEEKEKNQQKQKEKEEEKEKKKREKEEEKEKKKTEEKKKEEENENYLEPKDDIPNRNTFTAVPLTTFRPNDSRSKDDRPNDDSDILRHKDEEEPGSVEYRPTSYASRTDSQRAPSPDSFSDSFSDSEAINRDSNFGDYPLAAAVPAGSKRESLAEYEEVTYNEDNAEITETQPQNEILDDPSRTSTPMAGVVPPPPPPPPVGRAGAPEIQSEYSDVADSVLGSDAPGSSDHTPSVLTGSTLERPRFRGSDGLYENYVYESADRDPPGGDDYLAPSSIAESNESKTVTFADEDPVDIDHASRDRQSSDYYDSVDNLDFEKRYSDGLY